MTVSTVSDLNDEYWFQYLAEKFKFRSCYGVDPYYVDPSDPTGAAYLRKGRELSLNLSKRQQPRGGHWRRVRRRIYRGPKPGSGCKVISGPDNGRSR